MPELWTGITCTQRNGRKEEWKKHFWCFFFFFYQNEFRDGYFVEYKYTYLLFIELRIILTE